MMAIQLIALLYLLQDKEFNARVLNCSDDCISVTNT
jgi:hypothetical protein